VAGVGDPDNEIAVTLLPIELDADNDFIEHGLPGAITGHVFNDAGNANWFRDY
jgi:hypothetical protein